MHNDGKSKSSYITNLPYTLERDLSRDRFIDSDEREGTIRISSRKSAGINKRERIDSTTRGLKPVYTSVNVDEQTHEQKRARVMTNPVHNYYVGEISIVGMMGRKRIHLLAG